MTHFRPRPALRISQLTAAGLAPLLLAASPVTANAAEGGASREPQAAIADQRSLAATPTNLREAASAVADADGAEVDGAEVDGAEVDEGGDQHPTHSDEMGDMEGMDHTAPAGDPTDELAITEHGEHGEPADESTTEEHGEHGEPAGPESTRPRAAVLGSFAAVNGGVLLAAGWMRRRTKERVQRSKSARAAALGKS